LRVSEAPYVRGIPGNRTTTLAFEATEVQSKGESPVQLNIWAAGVRGADVLNDFGGFETDASNQLVVCRTLQATRDECVSALGDCSASPQPSSDRLAPLRAHAALLMAATVFTYHDRGSLVSLSKYLIVGSLMGALIGGKLAIEGRLARLVYVQLYQMH
jgi:NADH:ubiquinone reductase (H+-translocating)